MYEDIIDGEVEHKLDEYEIRFFEGFPLMQFEGTKKELIKTINKCLRQNKEYDTRFYDNEDIDD